MKKPFYYLPPLILSFLFVPLVASANESPVPQVATTTATSTIVVTKSKAFTTCSQDAIELRDTKLAQARGSYNNAMNALLVERKEAEKEAVAIEDGDDKKEAIKESVDSYKSQVKVLQNTLTQSRKTIWQNFENDTKSCRENLEKKEEGDKSEKRAAKEVSVENKKDSSVEPKTVKESLLSSIKSLFGKE